MATKITNLVIEAYLKCRYKGHLRMMGELGEPSEYELLLKKRRDVIHTAATAKLIGLHGENEVPTGLQLTAAVLRQAKPLLLDVTMENEEETVHFDALLRVAGPSQLGDFHYIPVLFHESERPSRELQSLLGLYGLILGAIQGKEPNRGILIHGRKIEVRSINLEKVGKHVRRLMRELREIQTGSAPGLILNAHCQICEFCQRCRAAAVSKDDLSLLRGMGEKEIHKYARKGIFTVTQLSCTFRPRKKGKRARKGQSHSAALQALAIREKTIHVFGTPAFPIPRKGSTSTSRGTQNAVSCTWSE